MLVNPPPSPSLRSVATPLGKLLEISSGPILTAGPAELPDALGLIGQELRTLLERCNGFYAFEGALHLFPALSAPPHMGLYRWNAPETWIGDYDGVGASIFCFAEDLFGGQFCIADERVGIFDPETGATQPIADSLEGWATAVLADYDYLTGHSLAHAWQVRHGRLREGERLVCGSPSYWGAPSRWKICRRCRPSMQ